MTNGNVLKRVTLAGVLVSLLGLEAAAQSDPSLTAEARDYDRWFREAAVEFSVPVELLQAIAYTESRWHHRVPDEAESHGMPPAYGIMGLRDDPHFGHSLPEAASLIGARPDDLKRDPRANIRGAAALLARYGRALEKRPVELEAWEAAVARYTGIPQPEIARIQTYEVFTAIDEGRSSARFRVEKRAVDMEKIYGAELLEKLAR